MTSLRRFCADDLFTYTNVQTTYYTETVREAQPARVAPAGSRLQEPDANVMALLSSHARAACLPCGLLPWLANYCGQ